MHALLLVLHEARMASLFSAQAFPRQQSTLRIEEFCPMMLFQKVMRGNRFSRAAPTTH
jgi:hypothetical protein